MINELSIIIPTLNEEHHLPKLLNSILDQNFPCKLQIIIVDGKSEDNTKGIILNYKKKFKNLSFLESERGVSLQKNKGANIAQYDNLIFADADIVFPKNFFRKLFKKVENEDKFVISVMLWSSESNVFDQIILSFMIPIVWFFSIIDPMVGAGFIFTTKENHNEIKGFTEGVIFAEDYDYGKRSIQNGAKYHFYFFPYALTSPRRARKIGRINLFRQWLNGYFYTKQNGLITEQSDFKYPYGNYEK